MEKIIVQGRQVTEVYARIRFSDKCIDDIIDAKIPENQILDTFRTTIREIVDAEFQKRVDNKKVYQSKNITFSRSDVEGFAKLAAETTLEKCANAVVVKLRNR